MSITMTLKIVSFNVSGIPDLQRTAHKFITSEHSNVVDVAKEVLQKDGSSCESYKKLMGGLMARLLDGEQPDLLCLQEMTKERFLSQSEHVVIVEALSQRGYTLLLKEDAAIAYKTNEFDVLQKGTTQEQSAPAYFSDLRAKENGCVVRLVSDHPEFGENGERCLINNLNGVDIKPLTLFQKILKKISFLFFKSVTPDLIIYGLDANGTRRIPGEEEKNSGESREWQPERLEHFKEKEYQTDLTDENPTLKFQAKQKIDHIFVKAISCVIESIKGIVNNGINDESILDNPKILPASDHVPVIYDISVRVNESWISLIKQIF